MAHVRPKRKNFAAGLATLEAALVFPILLLLTFGVIDYGWMFLKAEQITSAARHGARIAVRADATNADVLTAIDSLLDSAGLSGSGYVVTYTPSDVSTPESGSVVTVAVSVPTAGISLLGSSFLPMPTDLQASVTMAKEGP